MRILLIDPPYTIFTGSDSRYFPVQLDYYGSALKENGYGGVIYDANRERYDTGDFNLSAEYERLGGYLKEINSNSHSIYGKIE